MLPLPTYSSRQTIKPNSRAVVNEEEQKGASTGLRIPEREKNEKPSLTYDELQETFIINTNSFRRKGHTRPVHQYKGSEHLAIRSWEDTVFKTATPQSELILGHFMTGLSAEWPTKRPRMSTPAPRFNRGGVDGISVTRCAETLENFW